MNEQENDFESLRRLLAFKRHENPPPGYFNRFSGQVIGRIHAGANHNGSKKLAGHAPWLLKLLQIFETKPAFAIAFASTLCLLLLMGIIFAGQPESTPQPLLQADSQPVAPFLSQADMTASANPNGNIASTNPVLNLQPVASLFGPQNPLAQQVNFKVPGN
jgi:hypothetical protein